MKQGLGALSSYWYLRKKNFDQALLDVSPSPFFVDSGAFTAMTQGSIIKVHEYAEWLTPRSHRVQVFSNLDVIGDYKSTRKNQEILEKNYNLRPIPVFHVGSPWFELQRLVSEYEYIALGGMARKEYQRQDLMPWILQCFRIAGDKSCFHGFGVTDWVIMSSLPWRSVDSTTWMSASRFGALLLFSNGKLFQTRSHLLKQYTKSINKLGFSLDDAIAACNRGNGQALAKNISIESMSAAQQFIESRFGVGFTIYLAGIV